MRRRAPPLALLSAVSVVVIALGVALAGVLHLGPFAPARPATISKAQPPPNWALLGARPFDAFVGRQTTGTVQGSRAVDNGMLLWTVSSTNAPAGIETALPVSESTDADFHVVMAAAQVKGPAAWYGAALRYKDAADFYEAELMDSSQSFRFAIVSGGKVTSILDGRKFTPTPGKPNTLSVRVESSHFTFYVDDVLIGEADDARLTGGRTGLVVASPTSTDERTFAFSSFETYVPPAQ